MRKFAVLLLSAAMLTPFTFATIVLAGEILGFTEQGLAARSDERHRAIRRRRSFRRHGLCGVAGEWSPRRPI